MEFNIKIGQPEKLRSDCLILPVFESGRLPDNTAKVDKICNGTITNIIKMGDFAGNACQTLLLHNLSGVNFPRILLVGCGKEQEFSHKTFKDVCEKMAVALQATGAKDATCYVTDLVVADRDTAWKVQNASTAVLTSLYKFDEYKSTAKKAKLHKELTKITWIISNRRDLGNAEKAINIALALNLGVVLTKNLANTPPNVCNPEYLAKAALKIAKNYKSISAAILELKDIQALKMGAFLSVTQGSVQAPKLISLEYRGAAKSQAPIVLVGKGITFDSGGNSLKPAASMVGMKFDMCGAASVLGLLKFAAELQLPINIVGVIAAAENMPGGSASRPDDIVKTMSGLTVEILNTDAEGRLVLCEALTYCERFKPKVVIDMATLTGACVVALGNHHSALYSNDQELADQLFKAGQLSGDKCWQMPLTEEYSKQLDSNVADMANVGGADAGSITAACFLAKFTQNYHWAHLDIAGTACRFTGKDRGATGQPVGLVAQYLLDQCK